MKAWVQIDRWHLVGDIEDESRTRCGQPVTDGQVATSVGHIPLGEDTCEACLRYEETDREKEPVTEQGG